MRTQRTVDTDRDTERLGGLSDPQVSGLPRVR